VELGAGFGRRLALRCASAVTPVISEQRCGATRACAGADVRGAAGVVDRRHKRLSKPRASASSRKCSQCELLENIFRSVNIALVNELAMLTDRMGIDIWEVVDAASTKPYGFMRFEPRPGMGGHCLPVDPFYLSWRAREFDMSLEFIELSGKVNQQMPYHCVAKVQRTLNQAGLPIKGARIAVLGVSYKPGVGDIRESPALKILTLLKGLGAELRYHDPHVPALREHGLQSVCLDEALEDADLALIVTAHPQVEHELLAQRARLIVDLQRGHAHAGGRRGRAAVGGDAQSRPERVGALRLSSFERTRLFPCERISPCTASSTGSSSALSSWRS
jgi:nucleotide sugar dehydrogenase